MAGLLLLCQSTFGLAKPQNSAPDGDCRDENIHSLLLQFHEYGSQQKREPHNCPQLLALPFQGQSKHEKISVAVTMF